MKTTTIQISEQTWKKLSGLKNIGESFDDVIHRVLQQVDQVAEKQTEYTKD